MSRPQRMSALKAAAARMAFVALVLVAATTPGKAQDGWLRDGKPVSGQPDMAGSGNFGVIQIATDDPDRLVADWQTPTPGVSLKGTTQIRRGRPVTTFLVFKGCRADRSGKCNVTSDFDVFDPAGHLSGQVKSIKVWVGLPPAPGNNLQLSSSGFRIAFDDTDALGAHRVRATVTDHVAKITLHTEQVLTLVAK